MRYAETRRTVTTEMTPPLYSAHVPPPEDTHELAPLERRIGRVHVQQRLGMEADYEAHIYSSPKQFYHIENWYSVHALIRASLRLVGLYRRAQRNARAVRLVENEVRFAGLPAAFDGYTLLQISDPHVDMDAAITDALIRRIDEARYDACVLTGDFRARTFGRYDAVLEALARVRAHLTGPMYAVLGNHDVQLPGPPLANRIHRVLAGSPVRFIEHRVIDFPDFRLAGLHDWWSGRDDAAFLKTLPHDKPLLILMHQPHSLRALHGVRFALAMAGHTHGGQVYLPWLTREMFLRIRDERYVNGYYDTPAGKLFVTPGVGLTGLPLRFDCPPTIDVLELRRNAN